MRTIIIGDIHGHSERLAALLKMIGFDPAENTLVLLGNLIDYGPDSFGVYRMVRDLKEQMDDRLIVIRGDHEQMMMDGNLLTRGQMANFLLWKQNGGEEICYVVMKFQGANDVLCLMFDV